MKFTEISKTKLTEAFDNPYPFKLTGPDDSQSFHQLTLMTLESTFQLERVWAKQMQVMSLEYLLL